MNRLNFLHSFLFFVLSFGLVVQSQSTFHVEKIWGNSQSPPPNSNGVFNGGPAPRGFALSWYHQGALFVHGGHIESPFSPFAAVWKFVIDTRSWEIVNAGGIDLNQQTNTGTVGSGESPHNHPSARTAHSGAKSEIHQKMFIFGGNGLRSLFNEVWSWNLRTFQWAMLAGDKYSSAEPSPRWGSTMWVTGEYLWISSGRSASAESDFWRFSIELNTWKEMQMVSPQFYAGASWKDSDGSLWLFGGRRDSVYSNGASSILPETQSQWSNVLPPTSIYSNVGTLQAPANSNFRPAPRYCQISWTDPNNQHKYFFGGSVFGQIYYSDVWRLDSDLPGWQYMAELREGMMPPRTCSTGAVDGNGTVYIFSGTQFHGGSVSDVWKLYHPSSTTTTTTATTTTTNTMQPTPTTAMPSTTKAEIAPIGPITTVSSISGTQKVQQMAWIVGGLSLLCLALGSGGVICVAVLLVRKRAKSRRIKKPTNEIFATTPNHQSFSESTSQPSRPQLDLGKPPSNVQENQNQNEKYSHFAI